MPRCAGFPRHLTDHGVASNASWIAIDNEDFAVQLGVLPRLIGMMGLRDLPTGQGRSQHANTPSKNMDNGNHLRIRSSRPGAGPTCFDCSGSLLWIL